MPQYALIGTQSPEVCPISNKAAEMAKKKYAEIPSLCKKLNVKVLWDLHFDPKNKAFMLFEAPTAEAVRNVVTMAGFVDFLNLNFHLVKVVEGFCHRQLYHDGRWKRRF